MEGKNIKPKDTQLEINFEDYFDDKVGVDDSFEREPFDSKLKVLKEKVAKEEFLKSEKEREKREEIENEKEKVALVDKFHISYDDFKSLKKIDGFWYFEDKPIEEWYEEVQREIKELRKIYTKIPDDYKIIVKKGEYYVRDKFEGKDIKIKEWENIRHQQEKDDDLDYLRNWRK